MSDTLLAIIPKEGDPSGLLADGECGMLPPWLIQGEDGWRAGNRLLHVLEVTGTRALPLIFNGKPCHEGIERAERCLKRLVGAPDDSRIGYHNLCTAGATLTVRGGGVDRWVCIPPVEAGHEKERALLSALAAKGAGEVVGG